MMNQSELVYPLKQEVLLELVQGAKEVRIDKIQELQIILITDISGIDGRNRSLVIDHLGATYKFIWTTDRVARCFLSRFPFNYREWQSYLQYITKANIPFPYVFGRFLLFPIEIIGRRNYHWLNVSLADEFNLEKQKRIKSPYNLHHRVSFTFNIHRQNFQSLTLSFPDKNLSISNQLKLTYTLLKAWYQIDTLIKNSVIIELFNKFELFMAQLPLPKKHSETHFIHDLSAKTITDFIQHAPLLVKRYRHTNPNLTSSTQILETHPDHYKHHYN